MEFTKKPFFESKILIGSIVVFIASMVQVFTGFYLPTEVLDQVPSTITPAIEQKTLLAIISAAASMYMIVSRSFMKTEEVVKPFWKSGILWAAIITFASQIAYFNTGIELPAELGDNLIALIMKLVTTGDVLAFIIGGLQIGVAIWRTYSTTTELQFDEIKTLKPALTLTTKKAA